MLADGAAAKASLLSVFFLIRSALVAAMIDYCSLIFGYCLLLCSCFPAYYLASSALATLFYYETPPAVLVDTMLVAAL